MATVDEIGFVLHLVAFAQFLATAPNERGGAVAARVRNESLRERCPGSEACRRRNRTYPPGDEACRPVAGLLIFITRLVIPARLGVIARLAVPVTGFVVLIAGLVVVMAGFGAVIARLVVPIAGFTIP
jgi:hypothetical protein